MNLFKTTIIDTPSGHNSAEVNYFDMRMQRNIKILLCSKYNPIQEAEVWAEKIYDKISKEFVVYGLGMGYHILALYSRLKTYQSIKVIEANTQVHEDVKNCMDIDKLNKSKQVQLLVTENLYEIASLLEGVKVDESKLCFHDPSLRIIPNSSLRDILESHRMDRLNLRRFKDKILENYIYNEEVLHENITNYYGKITNKPIIIVSGGPSLHKNIHVLQSVSDEVFIFATGRVLKLLIEFGVRVNMFCIIDSDYESTYIQIKGMEEFDIPFMYLNTASYQTVSAYKGPKFIAYGADAPDSKEGKINTGGSVATAVLSAAIKFGGNPIIFIGQDLAHTGGVTHCIRANEIKDLPNIKRVKGINGEYLPTTSGLLKFKSWIENTIKQHPNITFFNCTEGGAYIEGCKHDELTTVLRDLGAL